jgi:L-fucose mutarotase/ribose pyranase (RbsD/FucU family)
MSGDGSRHSNGNWETVLKARLPFYGHRNWIVVADSAYPAQSHRAIETISSGADQITVIDTVVAALEASAHVRPIIHADQELRFVSENDAPGVTAYRAALNTVFGSEIEYRDHEEIISALDRAAELFRVLIIKTTATIPYTSVFFRLECAYWSADAEQRLRQSMGASRPSQVPRQARGAETSSLGNEVKGRSLTG